MGNFMSEIVGRRSHYETFEYTVEKEYDGWEIRQYPPRVAAQARMKQVAQEGQRASSNGFRVLAKYIGVFTTPQNKGHGEDKSGGDKQGEAVAMTTPVVMADTEKPEPVAMTTPVVMADSSKPEPVAMTTPVVMNDDRDGDYDTMQFILPAKFKKVEDAPVPTDPNVKIVMVPGKLVAAKTFSGKVDHEDVKVEYEKLIPLVKKEGYEQVGAWEGHFFDPPYTLPWFRRNDVIIPVKKA